MGSLWPSYFWTVIRKDGTGVGGYARTAERALDRAAEEVTKDTAHIGIQKQWADRQDKPLMRWVRYTSI